MNSKRVHLVMTGIIGLLLVGLVAGAYGANGLLTKQATKLTTLKAKSSALDKERASLLVAKKQVLKYAELNKIVMSIVPQDKDQAVAVREIVSIANKNGISLGSVTFPASSLGTGAAPAPIAGGASGGAAGGSTKPFNTPGSTSKNNGLSQLQPVKNIPGVYDLQIAVQGDPTVSVPYTQFIAFLSGLEHNRRTAQVSTIALQPDTKNSKNITFSLTLDEYLKP